MKTWSVIGLLFAAMIFATVPISPQVTSRGVAVNVDAAQAFTYGARATCKPSSGTSRVPSNPACCSSRCLLGSS